MAGNASCNYCKTQIEIPDGYNRPFIPCPQCKRMVTVAASPRPAGPPPARPAAPPVPPPPPRDTTPSFSSSAVGGPAHPPPPPPPPSTVTAGEDVLPEVMKANKKVLGKSCGICGKPIALGEQIHNCAACRSVNHDTCWTRSGGCTSPSCAASRPGHAAAGSPGFSAGAMAGGPAAPPPPGGTVPCRWCKEPIARGARKCKHCNEYQSDEDRATLGGIGKTAAGIDEVALSTTDWIGVVCCPIIALIQGLVYVAQGNPKGQRLILYSIISIGINGVIQALGGKH